MKTRSLLILAAALSLAGCGLSPKQLEALGPGPKVICHHVRAAGVSSTTNAMAASEGEGPTVSERCEINSPKP